MSDDVNRKPLVSVGMPVYNGERFIRHALDSLLGQDYENIEIIISDNGSTDGTAEICREYSEKDGRIRYYRNDTNIGSVQNFNRVFDLSRGKYFAWAADHDMWFPTFISRCVSMFEEGPDVVLVYSRTMLIDQNGNPLMLMPDQIDTRDMTAFNRYIHIIWNLQLCNMVYGLINREVLSQTGRLKNVWAPDHALLADLALRGSFAQIADPLFYRRKNRPDEDVETRTKRVLSDLDPANAAERSKASIKDLCRDLRNAHLDILAHAPISFPEKLFAAVATLICFRRRFGA